MTKSGKTHLCARCLRWSIAALTCAVLSPTGFAQESVALHCARGSVADYPDARLTLNERGARVVHVTFVGYRPSMARADWSLRDCLRTAIKFDGSRDMVAKLWYREARLGSSREPLQPYAEGRTLMYRASTGKIVLGTGEVAAR